MKPFQEMLGKITASPYYDQMVRFARPLKTYFDINHFWYYRITNSGLYTYLGTHGAWSEYCFENQLLSQFSILRHPEKLQPGISLMKKEKDPGYVEMQRTAQEKFQINFNINLSSKIPGGMEAFGFATQHHHASIDERILNELPLLKRFASRFRKEHPQIFDLALSNQVSLSKAFGPTFYEKDAPTFFDREGFLKEMKWLPSSPLSKREREVLSALASGYPASYIAKQLRLSTKTVENYTVTIKCKLFCHTKVELIHKGQELQLAGYL